MTGLRVHTNGPAAKERAELNPHMRDDQKEMRDGVAGDGQRLSEEDESRIKEDADDVNGRRIGLVQARALPQGKQQQQKPPQGIVVWEQFLPLRSLKVMLVENDNSTRHVVSALLRNCGYEVTAVTNCLEAWRILEDLHNHIDLVLTEVVMPILSGIGLLSKIMNHKSRKTIPVIMMSSNDSMGIVFRCLSKGAVDFLGKPIRKNELKNLWQHVWRKCHSSSGSGSESGIRTQKSTLSVKGSHDQTWGNGEDDNCSVGLNLKDGSDKGSGTQSSWSKRPVEVDRPQPTSPQAQSGDLPDSTCAQVIHSRADVFSSNQVPMAKDYCRQDLDNIEIGKDLEIGVPRNRDPQLEDPREKLKDSETDSNKLEKGKLEFNPETANSKLRNETSNLLCIDPPMEGIAMEVLNDRSKVNDFNDKVICDGKEMPSLKFSLRRQRDAEGTGTSAQDRNVLRRSDLSAFSRYNNASTINQTPTENVGCCSPFDNGLEAAMRESIHNLESSSTRTANQQSNGSSNNNNMGSTTNNVLTHKPLAESPITTHSCSAFQPVQNGHIAPTAVNTAFAPAKPSQQQVQVQHHHHHYHHHHHHLHKTRQQQQPPPPLPHCNDLSMKNTVVAPPANVVNTLVEGNAANYSSASGSQNGSNEQNGNSGAAVIAEGINTACDNGSGGGSRSAVNQDRFAQREAALSKFRQKRKERCFEKKVRYQSRKRLAEQRPRVRGQFVRQTVNGNQNKDTGS